EGVSMALKIRSAAFTHEHEIPARYTCEGEDVSPPLAWSDAPPGTKSFALIVDDPDAPDPKAPRRTWVHWVLYDIPSTSTALPETAGGAGVPPGTRVGTNGGGGAAWGGRCPPIGRHRYVFKLYALDETLGLAVASKADLERAMHGHVLGRAELIGT